MISAQFNCLFVHIPKTAGQSIEHVFLGLHGLSWEQREPLLLRFNPDPTRGPERLAHLLASEYLSHGYVSAEDFAGFYKFAFVRNPWDRLVSEYRYRNYASALSFPDFVRHGLPKPNRYSDAYRHIMPQCAYVYDRKGKLLVDFVGKFENLQADFEQVRRSAGLPAADIPHINASQKSADGPGSKDYRDYYNPQTRDLVARLYQKDIELFEYQFD